MHFFLIFLYVLPHWQVRAFLLPKPQPGATLWSPKPFSPLPPNYLTTSLNVISLRNRNQDSVVDRFSKPVASENATVAVVAVAEATTEPIILTIHGKQYNLTSWAKFHPGGSAILKKITGKDATVAFEKATHSHLAYEMLEQFEVKTQATASTSSVDDGMLTDRYSDSTSNSVNVDSSSEAENKHRHKRTSLWRTKLFTQEDPKGIHKLLGVYVLLHFAYRVIGKSLFSSDPSAGLGSRCGKGASLLPIVCVIPHGMLSLSSLIFHTVPRERVVGKPMIWQEFRAHNIIFGVRSVVCTVLAWASYFFSNTPTWRRVAIWGSSATVLLSNYLADEATRRLRANSFESTTATMPYWDGCSEETQRKFKKFYAYSQFMATIACLMVGNPVWPLSVLLAIQLASLLMTLVRKGLISARAYHYAYTASLCVPYIMVARHIKYLRYPFCEAFAYFLVGTCLFQLRRNGVNKYALWGPVIAARATMGDTLLSWDVW